MIRGSLRTTEPEPYYKDLIKFFPAEGVTLYPLAVGIASKDQGLLLILVAVICAFILALRYLATQPQSGGKPDWANIAVALVSFLLYSASLGAFNGGAPNPERVTMLMSFLTVMWVALVPFILRRMPSRTPA